VKSPKFSIVTPSYNQGNYIEQTISSVIEQGYPELEYLVMDGGSTDGTKNVLETYDSEIHYWVSEPDKGQADAIFRGFERASGEIIGWLNSDDFLLPDALEKVGAFFAANPDVDCVIGMHSFA